MKLTLAYFYPTLLNLYGDRGNVEIITYRARERGINVEVLQITPETNVTPGFMQDVNFVFMGGGPDSSQKIMGEDFGKNKGPFLREYIEKGGVSLFVCGAYQLMGKYYKSADGTKIPGLGVFNLYTEHFGDKKPRCVGNTTCELSSEITKDPIFQAVNKSGTTLVGFENHGGRTCLGKNSTALGSVVRGNGNNGEDGTEGIFYKNAIGTYLHGPLFSKNPHFVDYLLAKSLKIDTLKALDDSLILSAHAATLNL